MSTSRSRSRGRTQPSVRWATSTTPSRSPSRTRPEPAFVSPDPELGQISPRPTADDYYYGSREASPASRSRSRQRRRSRGQSLSRSRSRGPSMDRSSRRRSLSLGPGDNKDRLRSRSRKSWTDKAPKLRDENGKLVKSSLAILGAIGAASYVAHRMLPKVLDGSGDDKKYSSSSSSSRERHAHRNDRHVIERHHRYQTTYYEEEGGLPPRLREYEERFYADENGYDGKTLPRSDRAEPAWSREYSPDGRKTITTTKYVEQAQPVEKAAPGAIQPVLYSDEDDRVHYVDGEGRRYVEEYRSDRFWPGGRLP